MLLWGVQVSGRAPTARKKVSIVCVAAGGLLGCLSIAADGQGGDEIRVYDI